MKTPREIYAAYNIMPSLQLHQLRVAAVAKLLCEHLKKSVRTKDVVVACLFHDMGNIVKFQLGDIPEFLEPEGLAYWEGVKAEFIEKYGREQHAANETIAREIGLSEDVISCILAINFSKIGEVVASGS